MLLAVLCNRSYNKARSSGALRACSGILFNLFIIFKKLSHKRQENTLRVQILNGILSSFLLDFYQPCTSYAEPCLVHSLQRCAMRGPFRHGPFARRLDHSPVHIHVRSASRRHVSGAASPRLRLQNHRLRHLRLIVPQPLLTVRACVLRHVRCAPQGSSALFHRTC